jgi:hypothetical protein
MRRLHLLLSFSRRMWDEATCAARTGTPLSQKSCFATALFALRLTAGEALAVATRRKGTPQRFWTHADHQSAHLHATCASWRALHARNGANRQSRLLTRRTHGGRSLPRSDAS